MTLPVDAANAAVDIATGGDGSKESRADTPLLGDVENLRDRVTESMERIDD